MTGLLRDGERLLGSVLLMPPLAVVVGLGLCVGQAVWTVVTLARHGHRDWRRTPEGWR